MTTYRATFYGKNRGAIGIFLRFYTVVQGENEEQAHINLYERYDHIISLTLKEVV